MGNLFASEESIGKRIGKKQGKEFISTLPVAVGKDIESWINRRNHLVAEIDSIIMKEQSPVGRPTRQCASEWCWKKEVLKVECVACNSEIVRLGGESVDSVYLEVN